MKITNWNELVSVVIDSQLKTQDRALYQLIIQKIHKEGFSLIESDGLCLVGPCLLSFTIMTEHSELSLQKSSAEITFKLASSNMSLFADSATEDSSLFLFHDYSEFENLIEYIRILLSLKIQKQICLIEKSSRDYLSKLARPKFFKHEISKSDVKYLEKAQVTIYRELELDSLNTTLKQLGHERQREYQIVSSVNIFKYQIQLFLPLSYSSETYYFVLKNADAFTPEDLVIYQFVRTSLARLQRQQATVYDLKMLDDEFNKISFPIAVFDREQHLVLHNALFIHLNLSVKNVMSFKDNEQLNIGSGIYRIEKVILEDGALTHFSFIPVSALLHQSNVPSSEELGIVSSSIAHELNNPLGGILAAINVLELDEENKSMLEKYDQMKAGVLRCKKLVETFLGFSKLKSPHFDGQSSLYECYGQAMDLIRFRLIENNLILQSEYLKSDAFRKNVNPHVLSMILYLFLGELLTAHSHRKLVTQKNSPKICFNFIENSDNFGFDIIDELKITDSFTKSKLIGHLLETQNLKLKIEKSRYLFY
jgi:signal transduction histidine kinase